METGRGNPLVLTKSKPFPCQSQLFLIQRATWRRHLSAHGLRRAKSCDLPGPLTIPQLVSRCVGEESELGPMPVCKAPPSPGWGCPQGLVPTCNCWTSQCPCDISPCKWHFNIPAHLYRNVTGFQQPLCSVTQGKAHGESSLLTSLFWCKCLGQSGHRESHHDPCLEGGTGVFPSRTPTVAWPSPGALPSALFSQSPQLTYCLSECTFSCTTVLDLPQIWKESTEFARTSHSITPCFKHLNGHISHNHWLLSTPVMNRTLLLLCY